MAENKLGVLALRDLVLLPKVVGSLLVGRKNSINIVNSAVDNQQDIILLLQKDMTIEDPGVEDLYTIGVVAKIIQKLDLEDGSIKLLVESVTRVETTALEVTEGLIVADYFPLEVKQLSAKVNQVYLTSIIKLFKEYVQVSGFADKNLETILSGIDSVEDYVDILIENIVVVTDFKQQFLAETDVLVRVKMAIRKLAEEIEWIKEEQALQLSIKTEMDADKAAYVKDKRFKALQKLISNKSGEEVEDDLLVKLEGLPINKEVKARLLSDYNKLKLMPPASAEATVIRSHLEWVSDIPWIQKSKLNNNIIKARAVLDKDHFGLQDIKSRVLEHLAVNIKAKKHVNGAILCLVGPPGVGKTSLGKSIAKAMGREYIRIALGGVRDEAEIRGHRKTYIGAMPGRIIKAMKRCGVVNPLILLDEVDKIGMDFRGDPASALLEVLDPEQNDKFNDHYLEVDYDLSQVFFIATANTVDIPEALLDRMEIITISGYTEQEKLNIAKNYLVNKSLNRAGLMSEDIVFSDNMILEIIRNYTKEAGVRGVEKLLAKISRKVAYDAVVAKSKQKKVKKVRITSAKLRKFLGPEKFAEDMVLQENQVGLVHGMAWTAVGGALLTIEASVVKGKGKFKYTGSLGDVMQESMQAALTVVKSRAEFLGVDIDELAIQDIHVHVPEGATKKDGPSAGAAICMVIISAVTGVPIKASIAITGEITLRGELLKIGGLKEKLLAAMRSGVKLAIIPQANTVDLEEILPLLNGKLVVKPCKWIDEVVELMLVNKQQNVNLSDRLQEGFN